MNEYARHQLVYKILVGPVALFTRWKFRYEWDSLKDVEGPYLLLPNHNLELDPLLIAVAAKKHMYFVASEHIQRKGFATWALNYFLKPIIHKKGKQGANTVKQMLKSLKEGHNVCIFPEGNRSFNGLTGEMLPAIGRVAKKAGAKLITYRVEGGYLTQPRWSTNLRKGKIRGRLIHVYTQEELQQMDDEALHEAICRDLYEDAYETQKRERIPYRAKNLALGLESTIFACPDCGQIGGLHSEDDRFYCTCGFSAVYDVYGYLKDKADNIYTVTELDQLQKTYLEQLLQQAGEECLFSDSITWHQIQNDHSLAYTLTGSLAAYKDRIECCGETIPFTEIQGMAIYSRNSIILHQKGKEGHIELKSDQISFSALKYLYLYNLKMDEAMNKNLA